MTQETTLNEDINLLGLLDASPMCVKLFDSKGTLVFINKFGRNEHHITPSEDISKWNWVNTIEPEYQDEVRKKFTAVLSGSPVEYVEFRHTKEGSDHEWCSGALSSVKDEHGNINGVLFYSIDVSAKKQAEKKVTEKMQEIEKMNHLMVNRELRMIDLKKEIERLKTKKNECDRPGGTL